jgi:hypothetical protein
MHNQNLTEADVKFELVKFGYIFFILYAINDILLKTINNDMVACSPFQDQHFNLKIEGKMAFWGNINRQ